MKTPTPHAFVIVLLAVPVLAGCGKNIVRASSPSVASPPARAAGPSTSPNANTVAVQPVAPPELPQPDVAPAIVTGPSPAEPVAPRPRPSAPPAQPQPEAAQPKPEIVAPQISPVLKPSDQQRLVRLTTEQVSIAERNLQQSSGRRLNTLQTDLRDKVQGFLSQAHEAIRANDWVRAQNLAEKAQILSIELTKSL